MRRVIGVLILLSITVRAEDFPKTALVMPDGKEADVIVRLAEQELQLVCDDSHCGQKGQVFKSLPYAGTKSVQYSYSKAPRWKSGGGAAVAVGVFAIPVFFMKGKKHWRTVIAEGESAILHMDKKN